MLRFTPTPALLAMSVASCAALAQEAKPLNAGIPTPTVSAPQQWVSHQHWFCPPVPVDPKRYAIAMDKYMNDMGSKGWEVISFAQVSVNNGYCYVVTYKAPRK